MKPADYITSVTDLLESGKDLDDVLTGLDRTLKKRGHTGLKRAILTGLKSRFSAKKGDWPVLSISSVADKESLKDEIESAVKALEIDKELETIIDEKLIGGFKLTASNKIIDATYKNKLINLYQKITG